MMYSKENLEKRLYQLSQEEMVALVTKLYRSHPNVQSMINQAVVTKEPPMDVLSHKKEYSPGECKTALAEQMKTIKGRKEKVLLYYTFIDWILDRKDSLDFRYIAVASASFGKAMDILKKDRSLWDELLDESYRIAGRFYEMDGAIPYKAVEYYTRVKRGYDKVSE